MTTDNVETNGTTANEPEKATTATKTTTRGRKPKAEEVTALSVKEPTTSGLQYHDSDSLPNHRPIENSHHNFHESDSLPNHRPIENSHLNIVSTYTSVGSDRPITAGDMEISSTIAISGNRPIAVSHLQISETYAVMGNRPVASNEIDDPTALMGFLD
jgi:hypothetical protein